MEGTVTWATFPRGCEGTVTRRCFLYKAGEMPDISYDRWHLSFHRHQSLLHFHPVSISSNVVASLSMAVVGVPGVHMMLQLEWL